MAGLAAVTPGVAAGSGLRARAPAAMRRPPARRRQHWAVGRHRPRPCH